SRCHADRGAAHTSLPGPTMGVVKGVAAGFSTAYPKKVMRVVGLTALAFLLVAPGSGALGSNYRFVDEQGEPFQLRAPEVDLVPTPVVHAQVMLSPFDLRARPVVSRKEIMQEAGIRLPDGVVNGILFVGGAALLTSVILDFVSHHH